MLAECAVCSAGGIDTREHIESMIAIPYDADRDGSFAIEGSYACNSCTTLRSHTNEETYYDYSH